MTGQVSPSAIRELAAWEGVAFEWKWYVHPDTYLRCQECHQAIARMADRNRELYDYTDAELMALKVAHLRQVHSEVMTWT